MAGIGFQLRLLSRQETITSMVAAMGHAAVIAAGPWLFTIFALATITALTERVAGLPTLATFRVIVIYAFGISLLMTAPITIVTTRRVADALWGKKPELVPELLLGAFLLAVASTSVGVIALSLLFQLAGPIALALAASSLLVSMIWVALCFCGAVRDYTGVTLSFLIGLIVALIGSVAAAALDLGAAGMVGGFLTGLTITFFGLTSRVLRTFPQPVRDPLAGARQILSGMSEFWHLAVGTIFGTAGVWIDKVIFWLSPAGESIEAGLIHAPLYDSSMFISSLVIIPSLAAFVMKLETEFFDRYQQYYATIKGHGTIGQIERARERLASYTLDNLTLITVAQVGICAVLILSAPVIATALNLQFRQIAILRFGALGAVFQFIFIAGTAILLFFDRRRLYLKLQILFFCTSAGLTIATIHLGEDFYGVGYFLACLIASFIAYRLTDHTFRDLNFLTFIGNNPSVLATTGGRRPMLLGRLIERLRGQRAVSPPATTDRT
jgi:polysaccharide biosynthesis protein PelG